MQTGSMPPVGGWLQEKLCQADFHRPRHDVKFGNNVWDGETQCDIGFYLGKQQQIVFRIDLYHYYKPAVQFGEQNPTRTNV